MEVEMDEKKFEVDIFRPEDAEGVAQLFTAIYGKGYPIKLVYNPEQLIGAFERKDNIPVVARTQEGNIVGYVAMFRSAPHQKLYEGGQGLVLSDYRNLGVAALIISHICDVVAKELNINAIFGEAVCNHTHMQRAMAVHQTIETAIEVDLMPAEAYAKEKSAAGGVSPLALF